ncbi:uncharacterized protein LOC125558972 [Nematostella vectensis]|uniref:uncharacterized protein LOC125558972 n=1 Tax=Nematostella vectensis TaxID=45351 RepID=UPI002076E774|nr:uncharacterized protein LOC125558972 [Nematostella vectensis]
MTNITIQMTNSTTEMTNNTTEIRNSTTEMKMGTTEIKNGTTKIKNGTTEMTNSTTEMKNGTNSNGGTQVKESQATKVLDTAQAFYPLNVTYRGRDLSHHGNQSSYVAIGITYAPGPRGTAEGAMEFHHSQSSYLALLKTGRWKQFNESITIAFWLYLSGGSYVNIVDNAPLVNFIRQDTDNGTYSYNQDEMAVRIWYLFGRLQFDLVNSASQSFCTLYLGDPTFGGGWRFVIASYNQSGHAFIQADNLSTSKSCLPRQTLATFPGYVRLGSVTFENWHYYFAGKMACLMFFDFMPDNKQVDQIKSACA